MPPYSLAAGDARAFRIGSAIGGEERGGKVYPDVAGTRTIKLAVLKMPD